MRTAVVVIAAVSEPTPGSVEASAVSGGARLAQRRQPALLLLGRADLDQRPGEEPGRGDQVADAGAAPVQLLLHDAAGEHVPDAAAADLLGQHERRQPELGRLVHDVQRRSTMSRLVHLGGDRPDLGAGEIPGERLDLALLLGQVEELGELPAIAADGLPDAPDLAAIR